MTAYAIRAFTRAEPFPPVRVVLTCGDTFAIGWPDECVTGSGLVVMPRTCCRGVWNGYGSMVHVPLDRVARVEYPSEAEDSTTA